MNKFNIWKNSNVFRNINFSIKELNNKYNQLIKSSNPFCKNNVFDFNLIVDDILQTSIPYSVKNKYENNSKKDKINSYKNENNSKSATTYINHYSIDLPPNSDPRFIIIYDNEQVYLSNIEGLSNKPMLKKIKLKT